MKPIKKIVALSIAVSGITVFWLIPGIDKAPPTAYVRYYEDTDAAPEYALAASNSADVRVLNDTTGRRKTKKFKKEVIEPEKSRKVTAKMFSRSIQFEPLLEADTSITTVKNLDSLSAKK